MNLASVILLVWRTGRFKGEPPLSDIASYLWPALLVGCFAYGWHFVSYVRRERERIEDLERPRTLSRVAVLYVLISVSGFVGAMYL